LQFKRLRLPILITQSSISRCGQIISVHIEEFISKLDGNTSLSISALRICFRSLSTKTLLWWWQYTFSGRSKLLKEVIL